MMLTIVLIIQNSAKHSNIHNTIMMILTLATTVLVTIQIVVYCLRIMILEILDVITVIIISTTMIIIV